MIAVTGSTGQLGGLVLEHLLAMTDAKFLIGLARSPHKAEHFAKQGVTMRSFDFNKVDALPTSLQGVETLLLISGTEIGPRVQQHKNVIDAAVKAGVKRIVYTSVVIADIGKEPIYNDHKLTEDYIQQSGLQATILRDNFYMEPYLVEVTIASEKGVYRTAVTPTGGAALVSRNDVARTAAAVLLDEKHTGKTYNLTGPSVVTPQDFANLAAEISGKDVSYQQISYEELEQDYKERGLAGEHMPFLILLEKTIASGELANVTEDIRTITGTEVESFADFVNKNHNQK
ncbi:MAG: SDR family oxidoreductase [Spirochaetota bacterium]